MGSFFNYLACIDKRLGVRSAIYLFADKRGRWNLVPFPEKALALIAARGSFPLGWQTTTFLTPVWISRGSESAQQIRDYIPRRQRLWGVVLTEPHQEEAWPETKLPSLANRALRSCQKTKQPRPQWIMAQLLGSGTTMTSI